MKKIFIDISPGFYKTKLLNEVSKRIDVLVIYTTDYDSSSRNADFLHGDRDYPHRCLSGSKLLQAIKIIWILLTTRYDECLIGGYNCISDWIPVLFFPKKKNALILESTYRETSMGGVRSILKKWFFSQLNRVYACGTPHEKLARLFGFKGEVVKWYSVGLINVVKQPAYQPRRDVRNFLFVGRLIWQKNLLWLIDRFKAHPELHLTIVGFGEQEKELRERATTDNIHFAGAVDNTLLPDYYREADVFILPSVSETWGLVVNEALNNGTPLMISHMVGAADDMVESLGTGVIYKSEDVADFEEKLLTILDIEKYNMMRKRISELNFEKREKDIVAAFCKPNHS